MLHGSNVKINKLKTFRKVKATVWRYGDFRQNVAFISAVLLLVNIIRGRPTTDAVRDDSTTQRS